MSAVSTRARKFLHEIAEGFLSLLYPPLCLRCRAPVPDGARLCATCQSWVYPLTPPFCPICSRPYEGPADPPPASCWNCAGRRLHLECAVASHISLGTVRELVHRFKYDGRLHLRPQLRDWLLEGARDPRIALRRPDALIPIPLHPRRLAERGYNQALLLAQALSDATRWPVAQPLRRIRPTTTQTALTRAERLRNLVGAFALHPRADVRDLHLLLVDDVFTTGSTADECAKVLRRAGAASVRALTVARAA